MNSVVVGLDPGPVASALVRWDGERIIQMALEPNHDILAWMARPVDDPAVLAIEQVASYGMPVGRDVFETVYWSGRFAQLYGVERVLRIPRIDIKMHLCHNSRAKDGNIRQALIDRFGPCGTKKAPGLLYGVHGDIWAALAVAVTVWDRLKRSQAA